MGCGGHPAGLRGAGKAAAVVSFVQRESIEQHRQKAAVSVVGHWINYVVMRIWMVKL